MGMGAATAQGPKPTQKRTSQVNQESGDQPWISRVDHLLTLEVGLYLAAVVVGVVLRLLLIDARPLSVEEGALASESYRIWQGQPPESLHQGPLTAFGTALSLALFAGGDGAARLLSALFGTALIGVPFLLRQSLGRTAGLIAAWSLAFSPLMLFASRDVGSGIVPVTLGMLLWWTLQNGTKGLDSARGYGAALLTGALLASGGEGISVLVTLGIAAILSHPSPRVLLAELRQFLLTPLCKRMALAFAAAALILGTGLGTNLRGVQWVLVDSWTGWASSFSLSAPRGTLIWMLLIYELPVVLMAFVQLIRTLPRRERTDLFVSLWAMLLLLLCMLQTGGTAARVVLPALPIYLLAARLGASTIGVTHHIRGGWRWNSAALVVTVPATVGIVLANRGTTPGLDIPSIYLYGEAIVVAVAGVATVLLLSGGARRALGWCVLAVLSVGFIFHNSVTLNYNQETAIKEPVVGVQPSAALRSAARDASYYSRVYRTPVTVDPQLRGALEWYLRDARDVQYGADRPDGISISLFRDTGQDPKPEYERRPGVLTPAIDPPGTTWQGVWRWVVFRDGLVRTDPRDTIIRAPAGNW